MCVLNTNYTMHEHWKFGSTNIYVGSNKKKKKKKKKGKNRKYGNNGRTKPGVSSNPPRSSDMPDDSESIKHSYFCVWRRTKDVK